MENIKKVLNSLLIPYKNGITLRKLLLEYKEEEGTDLSYAEFGYSSYTELLRDCSGCVGIKVQHSNDSELDYTVYAISDERTQHIKRFVNEQKNNNEQSMHNLHPNAFAFDSKTKKKFNQTRILSSVNPFVPRRTEDHDDVNAMNDKLIINGKLVGKQSAAKSAKSHPVCPLPYNRIIPANERANVVKLLHMFAKNNRNGIKLVNFPVLYVKAFEKTLEYERFGYCNLQEFLSDLSDVVHMFTDSEHVVYVKLLNVTNDNNLRNSIVIDNCVIPANEVKKFRRILRRSPEGITACEFVETYFKKFGPLIVQNWGFCSPLEMFIAMESIFSLRRTEYGGEDMEKWTLFESKGDAKSHNAHMKSSRFDEHFKQKVVDVVKRMNDRLPDYKFPLKDFDDAYFIRYNERINCKDLGYESVENLLKDLSKEANIEVNDKCKDGQFIMYKIKFR